MEYVIPLSPVEGATGRRATTLHLLLAFALGSLGVSCLLLFWFTAKARVFSTAYWYNELPVAFKSANNWFALFGGCALLAAIGIAITAIRYRDWLKQGQRNLALRGLEILLLAAACVLFAVAAQKFPAAVFGALALFVGIVTVWEAKPAARAEALISEKGIQLPKGGMTKSYSWKEVEVVLLRHGILSIELSGNRLVQRHLHPQADIDAETIEAFCRVQSDKYAKVRAAANAW